MRLTRYTEYSLRVLIYLGQNNESRVTINQISEAYDISKNHLMKVVSNLTRHQFLVAQRGPGGGIKLNRLPEEISLDDVIRHTEKDLPLVDTPKPGESAEPTAESRLDEYLQQALLAYLAALGRLSLADVLNPRVDTPRLLDLNEKAA